MSSHLFNALNRRQQIAALVLRWVLHVIAGHPLGALSVPVFALSGSVWFASGLVIVDAAATSIIPGPTRWARACSFRRKFPAAAITVAKHSLVDFNESNINPPRIGIIPDLSNPNAVAFKIRPAVGSTLEQLEKDASSIAAQLPAVHSLVLEFDQTTSSRGKITVLFANTLSQTHHQPHEPESSHAWI